MSLSEFIARIFATKEVRAQVHKGGGTTVGTYTVGSAKETVVPLPPLAEQKRIVAKLDTLNAKSARARTELARIRAEREAAPKAKRGRGRPA